jgi:nitroreductase
LSTAGERKTDFAINNLILNRWSPRSMTGEELTESELMSLFEAARWAPSSGNAQPWRFIYAKKSSPRWGTFLGLLNDGNKVWAQDAAVLVAVVSRRLNEATGQPSRTYQFDAGAAWENLALEASGRRLVAHGMAGFDYERARKELGVPDVFDVMAMVAIGRLGPKEKLPQKLQERDVPSGRKPLSEIVMEDAFRL